MPKYLLHGSYTSEGVKGVLKEGGSSRRAAVKQLVESVGGKLEAFYYALGDEDVFLIVDMPDSVSVMATSLVANATGTVRVKTSVLVMPEEVDQAIKKQATFRPAGR